MASTKMTVSEISIVYQFSPSKIAEQAGVARSVVNRLIDERGTVSKRDVIKVLAALSTHTGRNYTLDAVQISNKITQRKEENV